MLGNDNEEPGGAMGPGSVAEEDEGAAAGSDMGSKVSCFWVFCLIHTRTLHLLKHM